MPEPVLERARVDAIVGELVAAAVAKHVRVHREGELGLGADPREQLAESCARHRAATLGGEDIRGRGRLLTLEAAQGAQLATAKRVDALPPLLEPAHMQDALLEVDLIPPQGSQLTHPEYVPIADQDHGGIAMAIATRPRAGGLQEEIDLSRGEVLARAILSIRTTLRRNCPIYSARHGLGLVDSVLGSHGVMISHCPILS